MTVQPKSINIDTIVPTKWKPLVGLIGSLLTLALPYIVSAEQWLPSPWPAIIGVVIAGLTYVGILQAPFVPNGAVLAPNTPAVAAAAQAAVTSEAVAQATVPGPRAGANGWVNPWRH